MLVVVLEMEARGGPLTDWADDDCALFKQAAAVPYRCPTHNKVRRPPLETCNE